MLRTSKLSPQQQDEIVRLYQSSVPMKRLAVDYGVDRGTIRAVLVRADVPLRDASARKRQYPLNEAAFDDAENNPTAAYFVGLLMADGWVCLPEGCNTPRIGLALTESDAALVEAFRSFLCTTRPLYTIPPGGSYPGGKPSVRCEVSSHRLFQALARYGVVPRKSKTARLLRLHDSVDVWRGLVDGDGSICFARLARSYDSPSIGLVGAEGVIRQFAGFVRRNIPACRAHPLPHKGDIWGFRTSGRPAVALARLLYHGASVALPRKAARAARAMAWLSPRQRRLRFPDCSSLPVPSTQLLIPFAP
jgi:hypothetical protein